MIIVLSAYFQSASGLVAKSVLIPASRVFFELGNKRRLSAVFVINLIHDFGRNNQFNRFLNRYLITHGIQTLIS